MPSDETRRVLKLFGVAVTAFEDCVEKGAPAEEIDKAEAEIGAGLGEVTALIERLRARKNNSSQK
jgi:microcompartment protein CcmK/EutM